MDVDAGQHVQTHTGGAAPGREEKPGGATAKHCIIPSLLV